MNLTLALFSLVPSPSLAGSFSLPFSAFPTFSFSPLSFLFVLVPESLELEMCFWSEFLFFYLKIFFSLVQTEFELVISRLSLSDAGFMGLTQHTHSRISFVVVFAEGESMVQDVVMLGGRRTFQR